MALRETASDHGGSRASSNVLVVGDDPSARLILAVTLEEAGHHVLTAASPLAARPLLLDESVDVLVCDLQSTGVVLELVEWVRSRHPALPVVLVTDELQGNHARRLARLRDTALIARPIRGLILLTAIDDALRRRAVAV